MTTQLYAGRVGLKQAEPKEGRFAYVLGASAGGGDGLPFLVGNEIFTFNSENINSFVKPKSIQSIWIDAFNLTASQLINLFFNEQQVVIAGGKQGYIVLAVKVPFILKVTSSGGIGTVNIILYNYNVFYTGAIGLPGSNVVNFKPVTQQGIGGIR